MSSGDRPRQELDVPLYMSTTTVMSWPKVYSVSTSSLMTFRRFLRRRSSGVGEIRDAGSSMSWNAEVVSGARDDGLSCV